MFASVMKLCLVIVVVITMVNAIDKSDDILIEVSVSKLSKTATIQCTVTNFDREAHNLLISKYHSYCPAASNVCSDRVNPQDDSIGAIGFEELVVWNEELTYPYLAERKAEVNLHWLVNGNNLALEVTIRDVKTFDAGLYTCRVLPEDANNTFEATLHIGKSKLLSIEEIQLTLPRCSANLTNLQGVAGTRVRLGCSQFGMSNVEFQWSRDDKLPIAENPQFYLGQGAHLVAYSSFVYTLSKTDDNTTFICTATTSGSESNTCVIGPFKLSAPQSVGVSVKRLWMGIQIPTGVLLIISIIVNIVFITHRYRNKMPIPPQVTYEIQGELPSFPASEPEEDAPVVKYDDPAPAPDDLPCYTNIGTLTNRNSMTSGVRPHHMHGAVPIFPH